MITCSIHSTEVASTLTAVEFAHKLITEDRPKFRAILENTILILVPSLNPDGVDLVTQWYRRTLGTPFEGSNPPELYHKYLGHDNNRDWYMFTQPETRNVVSKLHNVWRPQIVFDVHQQGIYSSRIFVPPWMDPIDPNVDPILMQLSNALGAGMAADFTSAGKTGVAINAMYDFWTPARHYQAYHGGLRILSESASARLATPVTVRPDEMNTSALGYSPRESSWNHLEPWTGGEWRLRDIVDYQLIAMESLLYQAAVRREDLLRSFYAVGERAIGRRTPYAFVIPAKQRDPGATRVLLETLAFGDVEIGRANRAFKAGGREYEAGSHVIRMAQPYSSFAKTLLEVQNYPDLRQFEGGPPRRPYDVTAHTLPMLMGVTVDTIRDRFEVAVERSTSFEGTANRTSRVLSASDTDTWKQINDAWQRGLSVWRNPRTGDFRLSAGTDFSAVRRPRVGLYKSWVPSMDEGWTRWLLERFGFGYTTVRDQDLQGSDLRARFDVIVFPDQRASVMHSGQRPGTVPAEFTGGMGDKSAESLLQFANAGGTLVFFNDASEWALEHLKLGVRNVLQGISEREFYSPGSLLNARTEPHPLTLGVSRDLTVWFENGPAFEVPRG
ncbi:MAG TPA: M14 family metallopeptidase, partial [Bryobacteraceae bacterium]|nr:M14 family metallopeptidase [Bryobacteraceae bacterium]